MQMLFGFDEPTHKPKPLNITMCHSRIIIFDVGSCLEFCLKFKSFPDGWLYIIEITLRY